MCFPKLHGRLVAPKTGSLRLSQPATEAVIRSGPALLRTIEQKCAILWTSNVTSALCGRRTTRSPNMKVSVLLSDEQAERFCRYCEEKGHKKSTLVARLIRDHLDREKFKIIQNECKGTQRNIEDGDPLGRPSTFQHRSTFIEGDDSEQKK